jgi:hypothetical protein
MKVSAGIGVGVGVEGHEAGDAARLGDGSEQLRA